MVRRGDRLIGHNTDGQGFVTSLGRSAGFDPAGRRCLVVGGGPAERPGPWWRPWPRPGRPRWWWSTGRRPRAAVAAALAGGRGRVGSPADVASVELVVNATPVGMVGGGREADRPLVEGSSTGPGQVVADLVYHPRETAWLRAAAAQGATVVGGLGMLVHQAAAQLALWTGVENRRSRRCGRRPSRPSRATEG